MRHSARKALIGAICIGLYAFGENLVLAGDEPPQVWDLTQLPTELPLSARQLLAAEVASNALPQVSTDSILRVHQARLALIRHRSPGGQRAPTQLTSIRFPRVENPYRNAARQMLSAANDQYLTVLVNRPMNDNERAQFIEKFKRVDVKDVLSRTPPSREARYVRSLLRPIDVYEETHAELARAGLLKKGAQEAAKAIKDLAGEILHDESKEQIRARVFGDSTDALEEQLKRTQEILRSIKDENDYRLKEIGTDVSGARQRCEQAMLNTTAVLGAVEKLQKLEVATRKKLEYSIGRLTEQQTAALAKLEKSQTDTHQSVVRLERGVHFLIAGEYDKASAAGKLKLLETGMVRLDADEDKNADLVAAEITRQSRLAVTDDVRTFFNQANSICHGLENLGVDEKIVNHARVAIRAGSALNESFSSFVRGDFIGGITSLLGGLFGGGPDPAEVRQQQLLKEFEDLKKGQEDILNRLERIEARLVALDQRVQEYHAEALAHLGDIHIRMRNQTDLLRGLKLTQYDALLEEVRRDGKFLEPAEVVSRISDNPDRIDMVAGTGFQSLKTLVTLNNSRVSEAFHLAAYPRDNETRIGQFLSENWRLHLLLFDEMVKARGVTSAVAISELIHSPRRIVDEHDVHVGNVPPRKDIDNAISELLYAPAVLDYCEACIRVAPVRCIVVPDKRGSRRIASLSEIIQWRQQDRERREVKKRIEDSLELLLRAEFIVNVAIAQQALLNGDALLQYMADQLNAEQPNGTMVTLFKLDGTDRLRDNLLLYILRREVMPQERMPDLSYDIYLSWQHSPALQSYLNRRAAQVNLAMRDGKWCAEWWGNTLAVHATGRGIPIRSVADDTRVGAIVTNA